MEPVDPVGDYLVTRGIVRPVALEVYRPDLDTGQPDSRPFDPPVKVRGAKGEERTAPGGVGDGAAAATTCTWLVTAATPDAGPLPRPPLQSRLTSRGKVWVITAITASPRNGQLFQCECVLANPP